MRQYLELGSVPCAEDCFQVGSATTEQMRKECVIYRKQLERQFPKGEFVIKSFPHDFGTYLEVVIYYDDEHICDCGLDCHEDCQCETDTEKLAYEVEGNLPEYWDEEAKKQLKTIK